MEKRTDLYQKVTDRIIAELEKGALPWIKPWQNGYKRVARPINAATRKPYRGVNTLLTWISEDENHFPTSRWLTFKQAKELGGNVMKGEKGTQIVFFSPVIKKSKDEPDAIEDMYMLLKQYTVFNVVQCEGLDDEVTGKNSALEGRELKLEHDQLMNFARHSGVLFAHGGDRAYYATQGDYVQLPEVHKFNDENSYWATLLHECVHWTGHETRCNRQFGKRFGDHAYAAEELVAEMGAAFLCAEYGVMGDLRHASYIESWLEALKKDKRAIFTAASKASDAADFLLKEVASNSVQQAA